MAGFQFPMWLDDDDYVDLGHLLRAIGQDRILRSEWLVRNAECAGDPRGAAELTAISKEGVEISGGRLLEVTTPKVQLIDGELLGRLAEAGHASLLLEAVDSTIWVVESTDARLYSQLAETFALTPVEGPGRLAT